MYLASLKIKNFRKFKSEDNEVSFVSGIDSRHLLESSIANNTTLIVGKNNAGKTTIIKALEKITSSTCKFTARDFNFDYLQEWLVDYNSCSETDRLSKELPFMEFVVTVGLDKGTDDYVNNLASFTPISTAEQAKKSVDIIVRFKAVEEALFRNALEQANPVGDMDLLKFLKFIDDHINFWDLRYYASDDREIASFKLDKLIELVSISAIHVTSDKSLTGEFNKILTYKLQQNELEHSEEIDKSLDNLNEQLDEKLCESETASINKICKEIMNDSVSVKLSSNITKEKIINSSMLLYQYSERSKLIPEDQFGLGYSNIVMIIAQVLEYMDKYSTKDASSKINIISIEEPETHMHPQMQELFMSNIDKAIKSIIGGASDKIINSQLIITTHSPHILNSKIHEGNSLSNIDFVTDTGNAAKIVNFSDTDYFDDKDKKDGAQTDVSPDFLFIKKHITLGLTEVFFSDAAVLVEGASEEKLIPYLINYRAEYGMLKNRYVSVINVGGAFAGKYRKILQSLEIPVAIITDLDIVKTDEEKKKFLPIESIVGRSTTNITLRDMLELNKGEASSWILEEDKVGNNKNGNIGVFFGTCMNGIYPTSLEEALYLANCDKEQNLISCILTDLHKDIAKNYSPDNILNSAKWQQAIKNDKGLYSSILLYRLLSEENESRNFTIPEYIDDALKFIASKLNVVV